jgi:hypothetical protein
MWLGALFPVSRQHDLNDSLNQEEQMSILDIFRVSQIKIELEKAQTECAALQKTLSETERMEYYQLKQAITELEEKQRYAVAQLSQSEADATRRRQIVDQQIADLNRQVDAKKVDLVVMDEEILLQSFGFYKPKYDLENSAMYKTRLDQVRNQQQAMVKTGTAASCPVSWTVNNSKKEGERMIRDYVKLIVRSFNNECDASIVKVKFNNIESTEKRIRKAFETLNSLGQRMNIEISSGFLNLKLQELYIFYEYEVKKQEEREEQKRIREQMREEAKLLKEIEDKKFKLQKEETHFNKALAIIDAKLQGVQTETERSLLEREKIAIIENLAIIERDKIDVLKREQNTRAGYVYIISNIGSFGADVYKIGVTRRLDPQERVDELGDASVPYNFDIHALIFSDDAPALENALHKAFEGRRLNMINRRREFFQVALGDIESVVKKNFNKPVEFIELADAAQYRQSLLMRGER